MSETTDSQTPLPQGNGSERSSLRRLARLRALMVDRSEEVTNHIGGVSAFKFTATVEGFSSLRRMVRCCAVCGGGGIDKGRAFDGRRAYRCQNCLVVWTEGLNGRARKYSPQRPSYQFKDTGAASNDDWLGDAGAPKPTATTALEMPKGYTLIRHGLLRWGWRRDDDGHLSMDQTLTAKGAIEYAVRHSKIMEDMDSEAPASPSDEVSDSAPLSGAFDPKPLTKNL